MKKLLLISLNVLILTAVGVGYGIAQDSPPNMRVVLALDKEIYSPSDPIKIVMTMANFDPGGIITSKSFLDKDFHLLLRFTGEDGNEISSNKLKDMQDPPPPSVLLVEEKLIQAESVEVLPAGWVFSITIDDARTYYSLVKGGKYSVRAVIPMTTYPAYEAVSGVKYARIDSANWAGALESTPVNFTLVLVFQPGDVNGDGKVDCADLTVVKASFGKKCGQAGFDSRADFNKDCLIDVRDLAAASRLLPAGTRCP